MAGTRPTEKARTDPQDHGERRAAAEGRCGDPDPDEPASALAPSRLGGAASQGAGTPARRKDTRLIVEGPRFLVGEQVEKTTGDYTFRGQVRAAFTKRNGVWRYVVENKEGLLHIFGDGNLKACNDD